VSTALHGDGTVRQAEAKQTRSHSHSHCSSAGGANERAGCEYQVSSGRGGEGGGKWRWSTIHTIQHCIFLNELSLAEHSIVESEQSSIPRPTEKMNWLVNIAHSYFFLVLMCTCSILGGEGNFPELWEIFRGCIWVGLGLG
jgi:hypothetical protein